MKLTLSRNVSRTATERAFPLIHSNYSVASMPNFHGGCARRELPSFRNISGEYFRTEARGEFQREALAFALIAITAAVPLLSNAHALADLVRALGTL